MFVILFQLVAQWIASVGKDLPKIEDIAFPLCVLFAYPILLGCYLSWRRKTTANWLARRHESFSTMNATCESVVNNFRLIADYNKRPIYADQFTGNVKTYNKRLIQTQDAIVNNLTFGKLLGEFFGGLWLIYGGMMVIDRKNGGGSIGIFLANVKVFSSVANCFNGMYGRWLEIETILPCLLRVTRFMNLPTELIKRRAVTDLLRDQSQKYRSHAVNMQKKFNRVMETDQVPFLDRVPIVFGNIVFEYTVKNSSGNVETLKTLHYQGFLEVFQGQFVCITGPKGSGKATLLKISVERST